MEVKHLAVSFFVRHRTPRENQSRRAEKRKNMTDAHEQEQTPSLTEAHRKIRELDELEDATMPVFKAIGGAYAHDVTEMRRAREAFEGLLSQLGRLLVEWKHLSITYTDGSWLSASLLFVNDKKTLRIDGGRYDPKARDKDIWGRNYSLSKDGIAVFGAGGLVLDDGVVALDKLLETMDDVPL
jgi:hypothetical protein